jgi:hypothetical protein
MMTEDIDRHIRELIAEIETKLKEGRKKLKKHYNAAIKAGAASPNDPLLKCAEDCATIFEDAFHRFIIECNKFFPEDKAK